MSTPATATPPIDTTNIDNLTFITSPVGALNVAVEGAMTRVLLEINKIRTQRYNTKMGITSTTDPKYRPIVTKPKTTFTGTGGTLSSLVFERTNWNFDAVKTYIDTNSHIFVAAKTWYGLPALLSYIVGFFMGAFYDFGPGPDSLVVPGNLFLPKAAMEGREYIIGCSRNVDSRVVSLSNMEIDDTRSLFWRLNHDSNLGRTAKVITLPDGSIDYEPVDTYTWRELRLMSSYPRTRSSFPAGPSGDTLYNQYLTERERFSLKNIYSFTTCTSWNQSYFCYLRYSTRWS